MSLMSTDNRPELPKGCYLRGNVIWVSYKDENGKWVKCSTNCKRDELERARRFVNATLRGVELKIQRIDQDNTLGGYIRRWLDDRERRGVASVVDERSRLEKYVLPHVGSVPIQEFKPRHTRDLVRTIREMKDEDGERKLAPRTVHHIYNTLHNVFESALVDEIIYIANPVRVARGELPKKVDADPEWRAQATYTVDEVVALISSPIIPVERRVMYALKSLAGMRHGEAAAFCWRHRDKTMEPLARLNVVQAWCSRESEIKSTKTEVTRGVPEHVVLGKILDAWETKHWPRIYGRRPTPDDFVVPARTMRCVAVKDANDAFKRDLAALELRVKAGTNRDRGGHDLRSWYETRCIEDGAEFLLVRRTTHAAPKSVSGGYERFSWATLCRAISRLNIELPDEKVLEFGTVLVQSEKKAAGRWSSLVTPSGLEPDKVCATNSNRTSIFVENQVEPRTVADTHEYYRRTKVGTVQTAARMLEEAIRRGDAPRALELVAQFRILGAQ